MSVAVLVENVVGRMSVVDSSNVRSGSDVGSSRCCACDLLAISVLFFFFSTVSVLRTHLPICDISIVPSPLLQCARCRIHKIKMVDSAREHRSDTTSRVAFREIRPLIPAWRASLREVYAYFLNLAAARSCVCQPILRYLVSAILTIVYTNAI